MNKANIKELKNEIERLRDVINDIYEQSSEVVNEEMEKEVSKRVDDELEHLRDLVFKDELTGVWNRRGFYEHYLHLFKEAYYIKSHPKARRELRVENFSIIFIDLDNFKKINDTFGHDIGDEVLKQAAKLFEEECRKIDGVARFGGEEFVLSLVGANEAFAFEKAEKIRVLLKEKVKIKNAPDHLVTASIGIASLAESDADDLDELVGYADSAMYEAKTNRGKDTVVRYSEIA